MADLGDSFSAPLTFADVSAERQAEIFASLRAHWSTIKALKILKKWRKTDFKTSLRLIEEARGFIRKARREIRENLGFAPPFFAHSCTPETKNRCLACGDADCPLGNPLHYTGTGCRDCNPGAFVVQLLNLVGPMVPCSMCKGAKQVASRLFVRPGQPAGIERLEDLEPEMETCPACEGRGEVECPHPREEMQPGEAPGDGKCGRCGEDGFALTDEFASLVGDEADPLQVAQPASPYESVHMCGGEGNGGGDGGCLACGARDCPDGEPLHYHHDGCPACDGNGEPPHPFPGGHFMAIVPPPVVYREVVVNWHKENRGQLITKLKEAESAGKDLLVTRDAITGLLAILARVPIDG